MRLFPSRVVVIVLSLTVLLTGCTYQDTNQNLDNGSNNHQETVDDLNGHSDGAGDYPGRSYTGGWGLVSDDFIEQFVERYDELEACAIDELENRKNTAPIHAALGEEVEATGNLAVSVLSVEPGPYDYADNTPTVKVTVAMRNLTGKTISVKASNWDADNGNGQRVDHKLYIKDERGKRNVRSFYPTKVSPNATFTGVVYFDGESLKSVIYEPHWLVSSQNQYIYFDL